MRENRSPERVSSEMRGGGEAVEKGELCIDQTAESGL